MTTKYVNPQGLTESKVQVIPVRNLTASADPGSNIELRGGEEIRVPEAAKIFVAGNVNRPGVYAMQGDADTTVVKALALSAGLAPYAAKNAYIYRLHAGGGGRDAVSYTHLELVTVPPMSALLICTALVLLSETASNAKTPSAIIPGDRILVILSDLPRLGILATSMGSHRKFVNAGGTYHCFAGWPKIYACLLYTSRCV